MSCAFGPCSAGAMTGVRFRSLVGGLTKLSGLLMQAGSCPQSGRDSLSAAKKTPNESENPPREKPEVDGNG